MPVYRGDSKLLFYGLVGGTLFSALLSFALSFVKEIPIQQVVLFSFFWGGMLTLTIIGGWTTGSIAGLLCGLFGGFIMSPLFSILSGIKSIWAYLFFPLIGALIGLIAGLMRRKGEFDGASDQGLSGIMPRWKMKK
ncbi:MAG: hypothetical protein PHW04_11980 [Candidatus Wallbacteria bacterium]|nr:hypothetical protein [Candidatus Wallbacteria bacterium]